MLPIWLSVETAIFQNFKLLAGKNDFFLNSMFQENGIKFLNYTVFSLNYFTKMGNDESNNS